MSLITDFADNMQVPVSAIKLLLTVYMGYIFGTVHRRYLFAKSATLQNGFFTAIGALLLYWNYETGIIHSAICIVAQWLLFRLLGTGNVFVIVSFLFQLGYLVMGYVSCATHDYDINWTMAHCILTLRLIGLCWDVHDGHRDETKLSAEQKTLMIKDLPSLLEMFGFCYFYGGANVGPQFPLRRFRQMINGELTDNPGKRPHSLVPAFRRCISGTVVLGIQVFLDMMLPESTMLEPKFLTSGFFHIAGVVCLRGHLLLLKYVAIWMINEGVCILSGLGYYKQGEKNKWDAVRNVKLRKFLFCDSFHHLIEAFNINTNQWVARYVFKRLRFLGNRTISHVSTLLFLAIWHGYHEGYFTCFAYEFLVITVEKSMRSELGKSKIVQSLNSSKSTSWITHLCGFLYVRALFGYCLLDFSLRKWHLYAPINWNMYYYGHLFYIASWILLKVHISTKKKEEVLEKKIE